MAPLSWPSPWPRHHDEDGDGNDDEDGDGNDEKSDCDGKKG